MSTSPRSPVGRGAARWLPAVAACAVAAGLLQSTFNVLANDYRLGVAAALALAAAQTVPLPLALRRPLPAWAVVFAADLVGGFVLLSADGVDGRAWPWTPPAMIGYLLVTAAVGLREGRRRLLAVGAATGATAVLPALFPTRQENATQLLLFLLTGAVLLLTGAVRERGEARRALAAQREVSEAERARRTLLEERARIAREMHDVVAHHMSVITVQADSAPYRLGGVPPETGEEFAAIAATARESLTEMRRLLGALRGTDGTGAGGGERAPQPGLAELDRLAESTVRAGVPVDLSVEAGPDPVAVPGAVDLSAYRVVQEALANVVRHAPGAAARVSVASDRTGVRVVIVNAPAPAPGAPLESGGTGHGLVGMRERVRLLGGTLEAGPLPDGGFRVAARFPLTASPTAPADPTDPADPADPAELDTAHDTAEESPAP
ncbi:sensor histidine kinase [Streptomyces sp. NPDC050617]|uniref:sensor histidine kinase n=1 Tax=Streptomyces sp. NPDC050617 TaxID=3154628 RepID=UPI00343CFC33